MKVEDNDNLKPSTDVTKIDSLISEISDLINKMNEIQEKSFSPEIIQESQEQFKFFKAFKETIQPLLDDSLTELTRQRQKRLLVTSALCLIIAPGVVILKGLEIEGAQIEVPSIWAITLAITVATLYYLIIFVAAIVET